MVPGVMGQPQPTSRRIRIKAVLVDARGGRCEDCGYARTISALEFHHRDPSTKELALGDFLGLPGTNRTRLSRG